MIPITPIPHLSFLRQCPYGNIATLYSDVPQQFSYPTNIFRCKQPLCNCQNKDVSILENYLQNISDQDVSEEMEQRRKFSYYSYTDFVRKMNHKLQNIDMEKYNKMYEKQIEMYSRIIGFVEVERDWLQMKIDRKDMGLYLTEEEYCLYNRLNRREEPVEFFDMKLAQSSLRQNLNDCFDLKCQEIKAEIVNTEEEIQKILETIRKDY